MKYIKRYSLIFFAVILLVCGIPLPAYADVVEFTEAAKLGATIVDLYGAANNTSLAYDYISDGSALTVIENLYTDYSSSAGDPYTLAAIGAAAAAAGTIAVVYDAITGKGYVQLYQTQYVESLDGFWDYTLSDLGFTRNNDGLFEWTVDSQTGDVVPVQVYNGSTWVGQPLLQIADNNQAVVSGGLYIGSQNANGANPYPFYAGAVTSGSVYVFVYPSGNSALRCYVSPSASQSVRESFYATNSPATLYGANYNLSNYYGSYHLYYGNSGATGNFTSSVPTYASQADGLQAVYDLVNGYYSAPAVFATPEFYVGDPLTVDPVITVPQIAGNPDYAPQPLRINTNIEWQPEWGDPLPDGVENPEPGVPYPVTDPSILNDAVPEIWDQVVQDVDVDPAPDPDPDPGPDDPDNPGGDPSEVFIPLLPVVTPSFNFNLSSIWHYVREWVASIGAWLTLMLTIWGNLPYAIVVPVYASLVIVIVLGIYKRFFM